MLFIVRLPLALPPRLQRFAPLIPSTSMQVYMSWPTYSGVSFLLNYLVHYYYEEVCPKDARGALSVPGRL